MAATFGNPFDSQLTPLREPAASSPAALKPAGKSHLLVCEHHHDGKRKFQPQPFTSSSTKARPLVLAAPVTVALSSPATNPVLLLEAEEPAASPAVASFPPPQNTAILSEVEGPAVALAFAFACPSQREPESVFLGPAQNLRHLDRSNAKSNTPALAAALAVACLPQHSPIFIGLSAPEKNEPPKTPAKSVSSPRPP